MNSPVLLDVPSLSLSVSHIQGTGGVSEPQEMAEPLGGRNTPMHTQTHAYTCMYTTHAHTQTWACIHVHTSHMYAAAAKSLQSCPTLCDPIDGSTPGSSVPGILQARTLEWVAISFSNA